MDLHTLAVIAKFEPPYLWNHLDYFKMFSHDSFLGISRKDSQVQAKKNLVEFIICIAWISLSNKG